MICLVGGLRPPSAFLVLSWMSDFHAFRFTAQRKRVCRCELKQEEALFSPVTITRKQWKRWNKWNTSIDPVVSVVWHPSCVFCIMWNCHGCLLLPRLLFMCNGCPCCLYVMLSMRLKRSFVSLFSIYGPFLYIETQKSRLFLISAFVSTH